MFLHEEFTENYYPLFKRKKVKISMETEKNKTEL